MGLNMIQEVVWRIVLAALAATALLMVAVWSLPLIALTTGAYPSMPVTVANVLRLPCTWFRKRCLWRFRSGLRLACLPRAVAGPFRAALASP
jgi:hypothetical protein